MIDVALDALGTRRTHAVYGGVACGERVSRLMFANIPPIVAKRRSLFRVFVLKKKTTENDPPPKARRNSRAQRKLPQTNCPRVSLFVSIVYVVVYLFAMEAACGWDRPHHVVPTQLSMRLRCRNSILFFLMRSSARRTCARAAAPPARLCIAQHTLRARALLGARCARRPPLAAAARVDAAPSIPILMLCSAALLFFVSCSPIIAL